MLQEINFLVCFGGNSLPPCCLLITLAGLDKHHFFKFQSWKCHRKLLQYYRKRQGKLGLSFFFSPTREGGGGGV